MKILRTRALASVEAPKEFKLLYHIGGTRMMVADSLLRGSIYGVSKEFPSYQTEIGNRHNYPAERINLYLIDDNGQVMWSSPNAVRKVGEKIEHYTTYMKDTEADRERARKAKRFLDL